MSLSARALGEQLGVSHTAVNKAAAAGRITREPDGGFDLDRVKGEWDANAHPQLRANGTAAKRRNVESGGEGPKDGPAKSDPKHRPRSKSPGDLTLSEIEKLKSLEDLEKKRRENARSSRDLLPRDEVTQTFGLIGKIYGAGREGIPSRLATKLVGKTDLQEIEMIVRAELASTDKRISDEIESRFKDLAGRSYDGGANS